MVWFHVSRAMCIPSFLLLALATTFSTRADDLGPTPIQTRVITVGDKAPNLAFQTLDGRTVHLGDFTNAAGGSAGKNQVVMLTFWCSTCHSCRHIERRLDEIARDYQGRAAVFALDASAGETASVVREFLARQTLGFPVLLDPTGQSLDHFGVEKTTTTLIFDGQGILRFRGRFSDAETPYADVALRAILAGKKVPRPTTELSGCPIPHPTRKSSTSSPRTSR